MCAAAAVWNHRSMEHTDIMRFCMKCMINRNDPRTHDCYFRLLAIYIGRVEMNNMTKAEGVRFVVGCNCYSDAQKMLISSVLR